MCPCRRRYARLDTIQSDSSAEARAAISVNSTGAANTELAQAAAVIDMSMAGLQPPASGLEAAQAAEALGLITEDSDEGLSAQVRAWSCRGGNGLRWAPLRTATRRCLLQASGSSRQETVCINAGSSGHTHLMVVFVARQPPGLRSSRESHYKHAAGPRPKDCNGCSTLFTWLLQKPASGCNLPALPRPM